MKTRIHLTRDSIEQIVDICETVERRSRANKRTVEMCRGIRDWVVKSECITEGQGKWIVQNAEWHHLAVPDELAALKPNTRTEARTPKFGMKDPEQATLSEIRDQLSRIEAMLKRKCKCRKHR